MDKANRKKRAELGQTADRQLIAYLRTLEMSKETLQSVGVAKMNEKHLQILDGMIRDRFVEKMNRLGLGATSRTANRLLSGFYDGEERSMIDLLEMSDAAVYKLASTRY